MSNYAEYVAGTHPGSDSSVLVLESMVANTNTATLVFQWPSVMGRVYSLWRATNALGPYTQHAGNVSAQVPFNSYTNPAPTALGSYFYGLKVSWPDAHNP